jgi:hypothetical protein
MSATAAKSRKGATISIISSQIRPLFALSSLAQPAYPICPDKAARGDRLDQIDIDPAEATYG